MLHYIGLATIFAWRPEGRMEFKIKNLLLESSNIQFSIQLTLYWTSQCHVSMCTLQLGKLTISFFWKTIVLLWKRWRKIKNETIVFKTIVLKSLTTTSSLTIVNEERKPTWRACTYHWVVFKKISRNLTSPQLLNFL